MRIADVRQTTVPIRSEIRNAVISFAGMDVSLVAVVSDVVRDGRPLAGFGFNSNGRYAQPGLLAERFIPRLLGASGEELTGESGEGLDPRAVWEVLMRNEKPGGHGERSVAVGILDMALWDLAAKLAGEPLHVHLAMRFGDGSWAERVPVYAAGGYYAPGKTLGNLKDELRAFLDAGYTCVKMKIGGAPLDEDLRRVEAALEVVEDGGRLAVDANGAFDLREALRYGDALEPYGLRWYEEPCDPLDFQANAVLAESYGPALATGENLFSLSDTRNLIRYGGVRADRDILQMDPALGYGLTEYLRIVDFVERQGISRQRLVPHGGHQFALSIAAAIGLGGNESYPGEFEPFGGFADEIAVTEGMVALPDSPGIGLERKANLRPLLERLLA